MNKKWGGRGTNWFAPQRGKGGRGDLIAPVSHQMEQMFTCEHSCRNRRVFGHNEHIHIQLELKHHAQPEIENV